jgi:uncharacterized protein YjbI with pentapeptide repeats
LGFVVAFAVVVLVVKIAADQLAASSKGMSAAEHAEDVGRARTTVLGILAGSIAVFGAFYTHRGFLLNREGQITDRYTRAVDQLGNGSRDVRIGGIYALERIARASREDHVTIMEVLTAFVREHCPLVDEEREEELIDHDPSRFPEAPTADVHAALAVLGRRRKDFDPPQPWRLDLSATYLPRARLRDLDLADTDFSYSVLVQASLAGAELSGARFVRARMACVELHHADLIASVFDGASLFQASFEGARLGRARFIDANMREADLEGAFAAEAEMRNTNLSEADLSDADLRSVDFVNANLTKATLAGADLTAADLRLVTFEMTHATPSTKWPSGFDPTTKPEILIGD